MTNPPPSVEGYAKMEGVNSEPGDPGLPSLAQGVDVVPPLC